MVEKQKLKLKIALAVSIHLHAIQFHWQGVPFIDNRDFVFFVFERKKHQPRRNLRSYLVLQRLCNEAALSPGIDAF